MSEITSRWTGGPYYLTPDQRRRTWELFERGVKQEKEKKAMKREKMKAEIGELIEELDRERMRQEFYKRLWPKGKWIEWKKKGEFSDGRYQCSQCKHNYSFEYNFCPNCGAKMDGDCGERREP